MNIQFAGKTDVGVKRSHNEDNLKLLPKDRLFLVADGMGGHASGEVASEIAVNTVGAFFDDTGKDPDRTWPDKEEPEHDYDENRLVAAIKLANLRIFEKAQTDAKYKGMGTTVVAAQLVDDRVVFAHVGDSRAYRLRDGVLEQLTEDHSLLNDYKKMANLTPEEEENFPHKNIIVRALGMKPIVKVDLQSQPQQAGDIYLLCSDGLSGEINDETIGNIVTAADGDLRKACDELVTAACEAGGKDNVTVVLIEVQP